MLSAAEIEYSASSKQFKSFSSIAKSEFTTIYLFYFGLFIILFVVWNGIAWINYFQNAQIELTIN